SLDTEFHCHASPVLSEGTSGPRAGRVTCCTLHRTRISVLAGTWNCLVGVGVNKAETRRRRYYEASARNRGLPSHRCRTSVVLLACFASRSLRKRERGRERTDPDS